MSIEESHKGLFDNREIDLLTYDPLEPSKWPHEKVNHGPYEWTGGSCRHVDLISNHR